MLHTSAIGVALFFWSMLFAGGALALCGLYRSVQRYRIWKRAGAEEDGELVFGDEALKPGCAAHIAPGERTLTMDPCGVVPARIEEITPRNCVLVLEAPPDTNLAASSPLRGWMSPGASLTVSVTGGAALYRFTSRVRDVTPARNRCEGPRILLDRPGWLTRTQRRQHARVDLHLPATFERIMQTAQAGAPLRTLGASAPMHGSVRSLSGGGLRAQIGGVLRVHELDALLGLYAPETTVRIRLPFPALQDNSVLARVRTCERAVVPGGLTLQIACEFLPMAHWEQEIVVAHVFEFQRASGKSRSLPRSA